MKPIYKPKGAALEYCDLALNIYDYCSHGCTYCYARDMAKRFGKPWGNEVRPRPGIVEATKKQLRYMSGGENLIHLCFMCDPFPIGVDHVPTLEIIKAIKKSGNNVKILTKGGKKAEKCFGLLDEDDWFGVTWSGAEFVGNAEPNVASHKERHESIVIANDVYGIKTWLSCEPVLDPNSIYAAIECFDTVDLFAIGKINHRSSTINWREFGHECERLCQKHGRNYIIKDSLRKEMENESIHS